MWICAACVLAIVGFILMQLLLGSRLSLHQFGWKFFAGSDWDPVNGDFGSKTQTALGQFQRSRTLPASGMLDARTLAELGVEQAASED